jgi:hypothetical protein
VAVGGSFSGADPWGALPSAAKEYGEVSAATRQAAAIILKKAFEPHRRKERDGKSVSCLTKVFHLIGSNLYYQNQHQIHVTADE